MVTLSDNGTPTQADGPGAGLGNQLRLILDPAEQVRIATRLAAEFDAELGFSAQHFAANNYSAATTGVCLYVLRQVLGQPYQPEVPTYFARCIMSDGTLDPALQGSAIPTSNWSRSQLLMALTTWRSPEAVRLGAVLAGAMLRTQNSEDGGFAVREFQEEGSSPLITHHVVLGLTRAHALRWLDPPTVALALERARDYLAVAAASVKTELPRRLLALSGLSVLHRAGFSVDNLGHLRDQLQRSISGPRGFARLDGYGIRSVRHPLWFTMVWRPAFSLSALHAFGPGARATKVLYVDLARHYSAENRAWVEHVGGTEGGSEPYTWATALGLLAGRALNARVPESQRSDWVDTAMRSAARDGFRDYDVAVSFAGADRSIALRVVRRLEQGGLSVFYDQDARAELLGEDLSDYLQKTYYERARVTVPLLSKAYLASQWAGWEWKAVLARMVQQPGGYMLPFFLEPADSLSVPGLNPTIAYLTMDDVTPEEFADEVVRKLSMRD